MKLFYSTGACSLWSHIVLHEIGVQVELVKVDLQTKETAQGEDFRQINPNGYIPALQTDDGTVLTEGPAIVEYLIGLAPEKALAPPAGTAEHCQLTQWINFIASEIHKGFAPLFNPQLPEAWAAVVRETLSSRLTYVESHLLKQPCLLGGRYTVADAYLFTALSWGDLVGVPIAQWPGLQRYAAKLATRPAIQAALKSEGLA